MCLTTGGGSWSQEGVPGPGGVYSRGVCLVLGRGGVPGPWGWGCLVLGGSSAPGGVLVSQHALRHLPPGETATAADGTHPTGMHSCLPLKITAPDPETDCS